MDTLSNNRLENNCLATLGIWRKKNAFLGRLRYGRGHSLNFQLDKWGHGVSGRLGDLVRGPLCGRQSRLQNFPSPLPCETLCGRKSEREGTRDLNDLKTLGPSTSLLIWALVWVPGQAFKFILAFAFYVFKNDITNVYTGHLKSMSCERLSGFFPKAFQFKIFQVLS